MTTAGPATTQRQGARRTAAAVVVLQLFAFTLMVFPSDSVIRPIGSNGYVACLVALIAFGLWAIAILLGLHDPRPCRYPIRGVVGLLWLSSLASYMLMNGHYQSVPTLLAGDRWLMQLVMVTGVIFVAAEFLNSLEDVKRVLRAVVAGGAVCGAIAGLQFWFHKDFSGTLRALPGFTINADNTAISSRGAVARVAGTALHPIELGVVAGMLLPLALYLALYDVERPPVRRWAPALVIMTAIPISVSRSGVLAVAVAVAFFLAMLPPTQRLVGLALTPVGLAAIFMTAPGVIGTLTAFFAAGKNDASVATRIDDYPLVARLVSQAPILGHGPNSFAPVNALQILDNQYYRTAIELGFVGLVAVIAFFTVPIVVAIVAPRGSDDRDYRTLCGALAGAAAVAVACSATFDSLSYPMFTGVNALVIGLIGAVWRLRRPTAPLTPELRGAS